jgi:hypothetical protein
LTQLIAANWQALPEPLKEVFRDISARGHGRSSQDVDLASANESSGGSLP